MTEDDTGWQDLCETAGLPAQEFSPSLLSRKTSNAAAHVILRLRREGAPDLVYKRIDRPDRPDLFTRIVAAQQRAAEALEGDQINRVPRILATDPQSRAILMEHAPGHSLFDLMERNADAGAFVTRAGAWLSAFHAAGPTQTRPFQPRFMVDHICRIAEQIRTGKRGIAQKRRFLDHAETLPELARAFEGRASVSALKHGDPIARNLILGPMTCWGLDFAPESSAPVGFDIARLLVNIAENFGDPAELPEGEVIDPALREAFFLGYTLVPPDDPGAAFLIPVRILTNWIAMPPDADRMSVPEVIRFNRLLRLARAAFG